MELTPSERESIYLEEKLRRENDGNGSSAAFLLLLNFFAIIALAGIYTAGKSGCRKKMSLESIRKVYDGLSPEEMQE